MFKHLLSKVLQGAGDALERGADAEGAALEGTRRAGRAALATEEGAAGATGFTIGATVGRTAQHLRDGDVDAAVETFARGGDLARRLWMGRRS